MTLIDATAQSVNTVYAQVVERIGADKLNAIATSLGINPAEIAGAYPSQVLGTASVSPLEMAAAYATFAAGGVYHTPVLITKVTKADGTPLPLPVSSQARQVLTPQQTALETYVLQQVVLNGTGGAAGGLGTPVAGKTGTTENSTDAWFIGYTPKLTTALWMGYPKASTPMVNFRGLKSVQGGTIPAQIWHNFMSSALTANPSYQGAFPMVYSWGGQTLLPPPPGSLEFPLGMGSTTTTSTSSTTSTSTTVATTSTTASSANTPLTHPSTTPPATVPPATVPATTTTATTRAPVTTPTTRGPAVTPPG
jgi:penicillin-binding protein 1A